MWSKKPTPVSTSTYCDADDWNACRLVRSPFGGGTPSNWPPSTLRMMWMLVSLVSRATLAARGRAMSAIFKIMCGDSCSRDAMKPRKALRFSLAEPQDYFQGFSS